MNRVMAGKNLRKGLGRVLIGAAIGAGTTALFLTLFDKPDVGERDLSNLLAIVAGLSFALMGVMVLIGAAAPGAGARFLNVEDADDLREQRPTLGLSAVSMILIGLFFLSLAAAPIGATPGLIAREVAGIIAFACLAGTVALHLVTRNRTDELMRQISLEATSLALHGGLLLVMVWAALAQFRELSWLSPLGVAALLALLELAAIFWVSGRRGLLAPR